MDQSLTMPVAEPPASAEPGGRARLPLLGRGVEVPRSGLLGQMRAVFGPALLVSVGYMDPGNWATDLQAGAQYRYGLLWVVVVSSLMAVVLQVLAARLGLAAGRDLAQACRDWYPRWTRLPNWLLCEIAIGACDLAEVLGSAVAINLLFHLPLAWAVAITGADVLLLLALQGLGLRWIEAVVLLLISTIALCYGLELFVLPAIRPDMHEIGAALLHPGLGRPGMVTLAIAIVGATVMPHNLYLHSALVRSRRLAAGPDVLRRAIRLNSLDTVLSLGLALLVNAAILVLAVLVFNGRDGVSIGGVHYAFGDDTDWIRIAYLTLAPLIGLGMASTLFAVALLASGQSSTITGTLAGQVVMDGFLHWRVRPWVRRLVTRALAIGPAIGLILWHGHTGVTQLLVLSQVVLAMQLPFAMFPLLHFTSSRRRMGEWANGRVLGGVAWLITVLITALDVWGLPGAVRQAWGLLAG